MKMIGKLNEKDLKINKKQMILWMGGILAAVILLMVFIVKVEPPAEGISRAEAAKALLKIPRPWKIWLLNGKIPLLQTRKRETGL